MKAIEKLGLIMMFAAIMMAVLFIEKQVGDKRTVIGITQTNYCNVITNIALDWQSIIITNSGFIK